MTILWTLLFLTSAVALVIGSLMLIFKRTRGRGKWIAPIGLLGFVVFAVLVSKAMDQEAQALGFKDNEEFRAAERHGVADPLEWRKRAAEIQENEQRIAREVAAKAEAERIRREEEAEAERKRAAAELAAKEAAKDASCKIDLSCWGEKHSVAARFACAPIVERMAKNDFQWTDGILEPKFSHYRWKRRDQGIVTYLGDRIKYQNGFGAWIYHVYECDYDPSRGAVVDLRARPGRLPPS